MSPLDAFELVRDETIPEINSRAMFYRHKKTGAEVLSLVNDDENKVFGVTFKTPPEDSTGVAHILEHSVLCGSRKYPLKKPFVEMLKGSMHTFLNAMTYADKTAYPVASQNLQDFYNLVDVYLDAVFFPLITEDTFRQEGWHYELEASQAPLTYKGVVFNEMKGAFSSPAAVLGKASQLSLYPDNAYGVNSGGDPAAIPNLTYEYFKNFHRKFYHPSNARIVFYGDDEPEKRFAILEEYLGQFEPLEVDASIALQPRFAEPKHIVQTYAAGPETPAESSGMVTVNWMLDPIEDERLAFELSILEHVLVGTSAAPLRKALMDSGLGEGLTGSGLADFLQPMFTVGLKGISEDDGDKVEAVILSTLEKLANEGIEKATIEASLNTIEFSLRENNTGSFPRGISVMLRTMRTWLHGGDPLAPLAFEDDLKALKADLAAGKPIFENLIRTCFLENTHRTTVLLKADKSQAERERAEERARLDAARATMDDAALSDIKLIEDKLKLLQETPDAPDLVAKIPSLGLTDLPRENKTVPLEVTRIAETQTFIHDLPTNGILYFDIGFDLHVIPSDLLQYLPIFGRALLQTGTEKEDFVSLSQRIGRTTGGVYPVRSLSAKNGVEGTAAYQFLRGKAVPGNAQELLDILSDVILTARLDNRERISQMVLEEKAALEGRLAAMGNSLVAMRLGAGVHESDWASEQMGGVSYLLFLRQLAGEVERDWPSVEARLRRIRELLINRNGAVANITADAAIWEAFRPQLVEFLNRLPIGPSVQAEWNKAEPKSEGLTMPAQVNYVGKGANLFALGHKLSAASAVALKHLNTTYMWDNIRVKGGAYGGGSGYDPFTGGFVFTSYRDPNLLESLDVYDGAAAYLREGISELDLRRSIIGVIGGMDAYRLPDAKGFTSTLRYLTEDTDAKRQKRREEVLEASIADFQALADALEAVAKNGNVVVLGSEASIKTANEERGNFLQTMRVM